MIDLPNTDFWDFRHFKNYLFLFILTISNINIYLKYAWLIQTFIAFSNIYGDFSFTVCVKSSRHTLKFNLKINLILKCARIVWVKDCSLYILKYFKRRKCLKQQKIVPNCTQYCKTNIAAGDVVWKRINKNVFTFLKNYGTA